MCVYMCGFPVTRYRMEPLGFAVGGQLPILDWGFRNISFLPELLRCLQGKDKNRYCKFEPCQRVSPGILETLGKCTFKRWDLEEFQDKYFLVTLKPAQWDLGVAKSKIFSFLERIVFKSIRVSKKHKLFCRIMQTIVFVGKLYLHRLFSFLGKNFSPHTDFDSPLTKNDCWLLIKAFLSRKIRSKPQTRLIEGP